MTTLDQANKKPLRILFFENGTASYKWRAQGIAERMYKETPHAMEIASVLDWSGDIGNANLVIFEMTAAPNMVDEAKKQGAKVIYEVDDAMIKTYGKDDRKHLTHLTEHREKLTIDTINKCDAMMTTNNTLKDNYARFTNIPIYAVPIYFDFNEYGTYDLNVQRNSDEVRIGWFGSKGHFEDLKMIMPALKKILAKYPQCRFVHLGFGGMSSDKMSTQIIWGVDEFAELPPQQREYVMGVHPEFWPMKLRTLDLDIGLAPLIDDYFNHCKTPIKWMEYASVGTPTICSPTVYTEHALADKSTVKHGKTALVAYTGDDWYNYLEKLVLDKSYRKQIADAALRDVKKNWDLDKHWREYVDIYEKVAYTK